MRYFEYGDKEIQYLTDFAGKILNREFDLEDIRKIQKKIFAVLQCGKPVLVGSGRRSNTGDERLCSEKSIG